MQRWAWTHKYAVPMFVSSLVAVILSGSGLVAVMVFASGDDRRPPPANNTNGTETESPAPATETGVDQCVVGTWEVTEYTENSAAATAELTRGTPVFTFDEDGTGVADFPADTRIVADFAGIPVEAGVDGQITYEYRTAGATFEFVNQDSTAKFSSDIDVLGYEEVLTMPEGRLNYTCDGDAMTIDGETQDLTYQRVG